MRHNISYKPLWMVLAALLCAVSTWLYANRVLIPHQISYAVAHGRPRGNLSDSYQHWVAARELFLNHRDPYSPEATRVIQRGYYGRFVDPSNASDPKDQRFAYPLYVVFLFAPLVDLPFEIVRKGLLWTLLTVTIASVPLWLRVLRWSVPLAVEVSIILLTIGSLAVMQGLKLQQMALLVSALVATAMALLSCGRPLGAGVVLALATIKPQLVWLLLLWLLIWTLGDWRHRYRAAASFLCATLLLSVASEWYLPHWIPRFLHAMREYPTYTDAVSPLDKLLPAPSAWIARTLAVAATLHVAWKNRKCGEETRAFAATTSLSLAVTIIVIPSYALYNYVLLLPALLVLARDREQLWRRNRMTRLLLGLAAVSLLWQWVASIILDGLSFILAPRTVQAAWAVPLWTVLFLEVVVASMLLIMAHQSVFNVTAKPSTS